MRKAKVFVKGDERILGVMAILLRKSYKRQENRLRREHL